MNSPHNEDLRRDRNFPLSRHSLKICASLVENPMNLGALCRTTEVFALESLVLPTLAVAEGWEFRKLAASAHYWQPLEACNPKDLRVWMRAQQQAGYVVLALTAHEQAHCLTHFTFPAKTALILGRELTGIPPEILAGCEGAIAIPQFGQVESLNVHTAAAIAIYEYIRQHASSQNVRQES
ncbi:MAG TPA: RNA methyltransferase [Leptolyngbyaceae cyanobacterium]